MDNKTLRKVRHWIVDNYGQDMINLLNNVAPKVFEYPEELKEFLSTYFDPSKELANGIIEAGESIDFKALIYGAMDFSNLTPLNSTEKLKTPEELMDEAGYILYPECQTEADIQRFRHYYYRGEENGPTPIYKEGDILDENYVGEELCTFGGDRLSLCRVWFAVKKNVDEIRREDFTNPKREDEYGTSVISIQFTRRNSTLSIKNRYNHVVMNPDCTFYNNLDAIIPGLSEAFARVYRVEDLAEELLTFDKSQPLKNIDLLHFVKAQSRDGKTGEKLYKFNLIVNDIYYCDNNIIIKDGEVIEDKTTMPPEKKRLVDCFIFDLENKTVTTYDPTIKDGFLDTLQPIKNIQTPRGKIVITKDVKDENGEYEQVIIDVNDSNQITGVSHKNLVECGDDYLNYCESIKNLDMPNLKRCGNGFCTYSKKIEELTLESLEECGCLFLSCAYNLKKIGLNKLKRCGDAFLEYAKLLEEINLESLEESGNFFMEGCLALKELNLPNWRKTGNYALRNNKMIKKLYAPKLEECGNYFFDLNAEITELDLPSLRKCGTCFFHDNIKMSRVNLPSLEECGGGFFYSNEEITELDLPSLRITGNDCFYENKKIRKLNAPKLEESGDGFFSGNKELKELNLPNWRKTGCNAFFDNINLEVVHAPKLEECGDNCFYLNSSVQILELESLVKCGSGFFEKNRIMSKAILPSLKRSGEKLFNRNIEMVEFYAPKWIEAKDGTLVYNKKMVKLIAPSLKLCGSMFLSANDDMEELILPELLCCGEYFLIMNCKMKKLYMPKFFGFLPDNMFIAHTKLKAKLQESDLGIDIDLEKDNQAQTENQNSDLVDETLQNDNSELCEDKNGSDSFEDAKYDDSDGVGISDF